MIWKIYKIKSEMILLARCYACSVLLSRRVSLSVRLSVTIRYFVKTAQLIGEIILYDLIAPTFYSFLRLIISVTKFRWDHPNRALTQYRQGFIQNEHEGV